MFHEVGACVVKLVKMILLFYICITFLSEARFFLWKCFGPSQHVCTGRSPQVSRSLLYSNTKQKTLHLSEFTTQTGSYHLLYLHYFYIANQSVIQSEMKVSAKLASQLVVMLMCPISKCSHCITLTFQYIIKKWNKDNKYMPAQKMRSYLMNLGLQSVCFAKNNQDLSWVTMRNTVIFVLVPVIFHNS